MAIATINPATGEKIQLALSLADKAPKKQRSKQPAEQKEHRSSIRRRLLGLEFRTFVNYFLRVPAQVVRTGGRIVVRLLAYNDWQATFLELAEQFSRPRRC